MATRCFTILALLYKRDVYKNTFASSEVSFDSSEVSFDSSEEIVNSSLENFHFPANYFEISPWRFVIPHVDVELKLSTDSVCRSLSLSNF